LSHALAPMAERDTLAAGYSWGTHAVLTGYSQLFAVTAERDALAARVAELGAAHAQCEALNAALAAQLGLKANAHGGAAQPLLAAGG
jgi:hypothetical protein